MSIKKLNRIVAGFIAAIMCLMVFPNVDLVAETRGMSFTYDNCNIDYDIINEWEGHQSIEIKLTNTGKEPIYNWALRYNAGGTNDII